MINELVVRVFASRNAAHIAHWSIKSGYNHETLGAFYENVIEKLDSIVESYVSIFGQIDVDSFPSQEKTIDIVARLEEDLIWINKNRMDIIKKVPALDNLLQELEMVYMTALFKLKTKN